MYHLRFNPVVSFLFKEGLAMISTEVFMDILAFHRQGHSMRWIAEKLGIHRNTVKNYIINKKQPKYRKQRRRESILGPYHPIIRDWFECAASLIMAQISI